MDSNIDLGAFKFRKRPSLTFKSNGGEGERLKLTNVTNHVGTDSRSGENNACATNAPFRNRNIGRNVEILDSTTRNDDGSCSERNLETLCEMFPNKEKHQLREILKLTNSLDEATCVLLDDEGQVGEHGQQILINCSRKRPAGEVETGEGAPRKKSKCLHGNFHRADSYLHSSDKKFEKTKARTEKQDLKQLREIFPHLRKRDLKEVLAAAGSLDEAVHTLSSFVSSEKSEDDGAIQSICISDTDENEFTAEQKALLLSFFGECSVQELSSVPGCSINKAQKILGMRVFHSWDDLVSKLTARKGVSTLVLSDCLTLLEERDQVGSLMNRCETISRKIQKMQTSHKEVNENASGNAEDDDVVILDESPKQASIKSQPKLLTSSRQLKPYQLEGLNWLALMHKQGVNGILADEMGLGKTVQTIAFLAQLIESNRRRRHLIVVPLSTLANWVRELEVWCPSLDVLRYHGSKDERMEMKFNLHEQELSFQVMVTTYSVAKEDLGFFRKLDFHYVVYDEAHMLKNMKSQRYQQLMKIRASRRLLLTGTPLQNNLLELMSLLSFLMPEMFDASAQGLKFIFSNKAQGDSDSRYERERVEQAKRIMQPFVLRRLKADVLQQLPQKHVHTVTCPLTNTQRQLYDDVFVTCSAEYKLRKDKASKSRNDQNILMKLRKAANHPLLLRTRYHDDQLMEMAREYCEDPLHFDSSPDVVFEDMTVMSDFELHVLCKQETSLRRHSLERDLLLDSGKFSWLDFQLPLLKNQDSRVLLFSQFTMAMDILEEYLKVRGHAYVRLDGSTKVEERQSLIDRYNSDQSIFVFLLSTKAGGLGINLVAANVVILHDIDFNPHNDKQAEDRSHRVGQTRDVHVYKLISENTMEEAMLRCAERKLKLEQDMATITEGDTPDVNRDKFLHDVFA